MNMSGSVEDADTLKKAVKAAYDSGIPIAKSAGNKDEVARNGICMSVSHVASGNERLC
jgi:hypothetical protein